MAEKVNITEKLASFSDQWAPRIVARYNDNEVRIVKVEGEFIWHSHEDTDELFLVLDGTLEMELRDRTVTLDGGRAVSCAARNGASSVRAKGGSETAADRSQGPAKHWRCNDRNESHRDLEHRREALAREVG